jgi:hypothetical protein
MPADQVITTIPGYTLLRFWFFETSKANINAATDQTVKRPIIAWRVQADGRALPIAVASPPDVENFVGEECIVGPFSIYSLDDIRSWGDSASGKKMWSRAGPHGSPIQRPPPRPPRLNNPA